ncbi:acyl-CoA dehydrogenase family protein [Pseudomonas sp. CCC3.1]|uniref:acyl-CoA dehydrogenase family protein n=2 Tax=unclassified Pseudomonas TaxID=196821 RepID=UPI002AC9DDF2|nr:acyl-CoA dehydrogenase family protein [Pseudomonas sp. CCC3.1]MEB0205960.1 acyl-CoA dehydrogenase family protein [Pseudomonas sp. CCC3.1]WPX38361.1 acyl-CoA dehydrogenase family protein [Pseudomonas sp. CCC3.1]
MTLDCNSLPDEAFRTLFREWVLENCPMELRYLRKQRPVYEEVKVWYQALAKKGWLSPVWPREYGGMGLSPAKHMIYVEEWGRLGCPRIPDHGIGLTGPLLIHHGSEAQKAEFLPKILSGEHIWCQGYSEPNAGSDLASLRTTAVLDGEHFIVNGQKIWTTLAHCANWIFVLVRTDKEAKPQRGISVLLVEMSTPGVDVRTIENLRGEADFCEVFFENVRVPVHNLVGDLNNGWTLAKSVLGHERIFLGSPTRAEYALDRLDRLAADRGAFEDPAFLSRYAKLRLDLYDLGSSYERYAKVLRSGGELGADVSVLKVFATELYQRITEEMLNLAQEEARYNDDLLIEGGQIDAMNLFLDARAPAIFGGSNEIQRNILAKAVLHLPG